MQTPVEILTTLLETLGFEFEIEPMRTISGKVLQIRTPDRQLLIGHEGETLDDLQFLLNRLLQVQDPTSPKAHLDVEFYREERNAALLHQLKEYADLVRTTGKPFYLEPMKAYERRIVHNAFRDDPDITTWSPEGEDAVKRITLLRREG